MPETTVASLRSSLKLSNNRDCFLRLKRNLAVIARDHLDPNKTTSVQKDSLKDIEEELKQTFPDFFDGEGNKKALGHAITYIKQHHSQWRHGLGLGTKRPNHGRANKRAKSSRSSSRSLSVPLRLTVLKKEKEDENVLGKPPEPPSSSSTDNTREALRTPLLERMAQNLALFSSQPSATGVFASQHMCHHAPLPRHGSISGTQYSPFPTQTPLVTANRSWQDYSSSSPSWRGEEGNSNQRSTFVSSSQQAAFFPSPSVAPSSSSSSMRTTTSVPSRQIAIVYQFLHSCVPSLDHLLQSFIDFGCSSEEFLLGISMWPRERIEDFLDKLPPAPDGTPISPMEKLVLRNQFLNYFS